jgi:histidine ammonia-lyase
VENTYQILANELVSLIQASNIAKKEGDFSLQIENFRNEILTFITPFTEDTPAYKKIERLKSHLQYIQ